MLVYSPEEGEMRVDYSSIDSIKHYLKIFASGDDCCGTTIRESKSLGR